MKFLYDNGRLLSDVCLHQLLVLAILISPQWPHQGEAVGNDTDRLALMKFKEGILVDPDRVFDSWSDSIPVCNWTGVTCGHQHQRVTSLVLQGHRLVGPVSGYIGNLSFLRVLDIRNNSLTGEIPQETGKLFRLEQLFLNNNTLVGGIPANLTGCSQLRFLYLMYNNLSGEIPPGLGSLVKLEKIQLSANSLSGEFPATLGNITSLTFFSVAFNYFVGKIPDSIGRLPGLQFLYIGGNNISGMIPSALFNISSMVGISTVANPLTGTLPDDMGLTLPNLQYFGISDNKFYGSIPRSIANATGLQIFDISYNSFVGQVPTNLGNLQNLWWLHLGDNSLGTNSKKDLDFMASLQNCSNLDILYIPGNNLGGSLPSSIGNFSIRLSKLSFARNQFTGIIPAEIGNLVNLIVVDMANNLLTGNIPSDFVKLQKLQGFGLNGNRLSGPVPSFIGNLTQLVGLYLSQNSFEGSLPQSIGNLVNLLETDLAQNNFNGSIPNQLLGLSSLSTFLNLSKNAFTGDLSPVVEKLTHLSLLDLSENKLSGEVPTTIGECSSLQYLYMQGNLFRGSIPSSVTSLESIVYLDLSRNNLTGEIPNGLQNLTYLSYLNVSFNDLEGEVPTEGIFSRASSISLIGNTKLCGGLTELGLPRCPETSKKKGKSNRFKLIAIVISVFMFVVASALAFLFFSRNRKPKKRASSEDDSMNQFLKVSYRDLYRATDGFSSSNLIGTGSYGCVYFAHLDQVERPIAVKVLNLQQKGASKSFEAECSALRNVRHRNLVKIITYCSSLDNEGIEFKALVFEYMENGSLDKWLHPEIDCNNHSTNLDLLQRLNITLDVASALHYLHDHSEVPIIHRDLKPSNILLDQEMVAHVSDFGLARLLPLTEEFSESQISTTGLRGTIGYAAPEYGMGGAASKEADVYSYGILMLEIFTGRRPTDGIFEDGLNLHNFVKAALPDRLMSIIDPTLLQNLRDYQVTREGAATERQDGIEREDPALGETRSGENTSNMIVNVGMLSILATGVEEGGQQAGHSTVINMKMRPHVASCLASILEIGVSCSEESPSQRANLGDVLRKLHKVKDAFMSAQLNEERRRSRQPRECYYY